MKSWSVCIALVALVPLVQGFSARNQEQYQVGPDDHVVTEILRMHRVLREKDSGACDRIAAAMKGSRVATEPLDASGFAKDLPSLMRASEIVVFAIINSVGMPSPSGEAVV